MPHLDPALRDERLGGDACEHPHRLLDDLTARGRLDVLRVEGDRDAGGERGPLLVVPEVQRAVRVELVGVAVEPGGGVDHDRLGFDDASGLSHGGPLCATILWVESEGNREAVG